MINLTVKTLDSRNHQFSVDDDITVEQFKRHISDTVNIPAETQRIIYCGRVLQDSSKLNDYDVDGKVVHLVQRPPPGANPPSSRSSRSSSPHPQRRVLRGLDHGNAMFLGSVAFPTNIMDTQNIVPTPPTHSHAGSRLNLARRMLRRAEHVIIQLENPNRSSADSTPVEDPQDEVTPVIEARVIVPSNSSEPLDEAAILSAVHNYSLLSGQNRRGGQNSTNTTGESSMAEPTAPSNNTSAASETVGDSQPAPSADPSSPSSNFPENGTRTSAMADLLTLLSQLQIRFAPFLQRYHNFMRLDAVVSEEDAATVQTELNRVSEVLHFLGHAYHSLSDIIIRVNIPPPRPLLCRPILIQHSVVQTGIPIQVEAQINLTNERPPSSASSTQSTATSGGETTPTSNNAPTTAPTATPQPFAAQAVPVISTVRVPIPLEIRGIVPPQGGNAPFVSSSASLINRDMMNAAMNFGISAANAVVSSAGVAATTAASAPSTNGNGRNAPSGFGSSNPEVEFIMEVTPEGITIDSLEAGIIGPNQADDLLRGALNGPQQPNLIQSIMQMAGQLINRRGNASGGSDLPPSNNAQQSSATSAPPLTPAPPTQNSQARGNNQTHPTSSTQTRSTPRPHVHLQQQTMQIGFDPFLPCNSHHVSRRRTGSGGGQAGPQQQGTPTTTGQRTEQDQFTSAAQDATTQLNSLMSSIVNSIRSSHLMRRSQSQPEASSTASQTTSASMQGAGETGSRLNVENASPSAPNTDTGSRMPPHGPPNMAELMRNGPTLAEIFQQLPPDISYVPGESVVRDFLMLLSRHLTIGDTVSLNNGNLAPLARITNEIQNFFMSSILNGSRTRAAIESGVERVIAELQPFLDILVQLPIRDDIDIAASVRRLIRARLPPIFLLSCRTADEPGNIRGIVNLFVAAIKELCALTLHACADGSLGIDQVFEIVATRFMQGIPSDLQDFILMSSRTDFRRLMTNLNVPTSTIESYIVRKTKTDDEENNDVGVDEQTAAAATAAPGKEQQRETENEQAMETDESNGLFENNRASTSPLSEAAPARLEEFPEPLPNVVIGSEPWHNQVPADWVPIIARDAQRQKKQHSQTPFSDAYLAGMPSKRRKLVHGTKGRQGLPLPQIIAESVRRAVTTTGLTSAAPLEVVAQAAGSSSEIQAAYRGLLRSSVQEGLRNNDDFTPERFPHAASYFGGGS